MPSSLVVQSRHRRLLVLLLLPVVGILLLSGGLAFLLLPLFVEDTRFRHTGGQIQLPWTLWLSTAILIGTSILFERGYWLVRHERQAGFRRCLVIASVGVGLFLILQTYGLSTLLFRHALLPEGDSRSYGLIAVLILLHLAHVVCGLVPLAIVVWKAFHGRYDHEWHSGVQLCNLYFHFLGAVWLVLLLMFVLGR